MKAAYNRGLPPRLAVLGSSILTCLLVLSLPALARPVSRPKSALTRVRTLTANMPMKLTNLRQQARATTGFIITSGGGAGITFSIENGVITSPGHTLSGHLAQPEPPSAANDFKGCLHLHFHGSIDGRPDPDPKGCGWGIVAPFNSGGTSTMEHLGQTANPKNGDLLEPPGPDFGSPNSPEMTKNESWYLDELFKLTGETIEMFHGAFGQEVINEMFGEIEKELERMKREAPSSKLPPIFEAPPPPLDSGLQPLGQAINDADRQHAAVPQPGMLK